MIVLDTHVSIWVMQDDPHLGDRAREAVQVAAKENGVWIPAIGPWEVAMLAAKGRLALSRDVGVWLAEALALPGLRVEPLTMPVGVDSARLPGEVHGDPADRLVIATARHLKATLLTADRKILAYARSGHVLAWDASL
jgi:PIN domain nuclease of toxin-antitoxin system